MFRFSESCESFQAIDGLDGDEELLLRVDITSSRAAQMSNNLGCKSVDIRSDDPFGTG